MLLVYEALSPQTHQRLLQLNLNQSLLSLPQRIFAAPARLHARHIPQHLKKEEEKVCIEV
jgi:hypothetical protein